MHYTIKTVKCQPRGRKILLIILQNKERPAKNRAPKDMLVFVKTTIFICNI